MDQQQELLEVHVLQSEQEQAGIVEFEPQYMTLEDRMALCIKYERHMHRNFGPYHALFLAFDDQYRARVCLQNIRAAKDMKLVPLGDFDKVIAEGTNNA